MDSPALEVFQQRVVGRSSLSYVSDVDSLPWQRVRQHLKLVSFCSTDYDSILALTKVAKD